MPRVKRTRFTQRRVLTFPRIKSTNSTPSPSKAMPPLPEQGGGGGSSSGVVAISNQPSPPELPKLCCVVCYNEFPYYALSCTTWEASVTRDFYVALNLPVGEDAVAGLPFCPECHSKVSVMFSHHQNLQSALQSFNCFRNEIAFTVVDSIALNCRPGPLDLIRQQIHTRWKDLYDESKKVKTGDVYDPVSTLDYLKPRLSVADEFPADPVTLSLSAAAKQRLAQLRQTPVTLMNERGRANRFLSQGPSSALRQITGNGNQMPVPPVASGSRMSNGNTKNNLGMPKLEPMPKISSPPKKTVGSLMRLDGVGFGQSRLGGKDGKVVRKLGVVLSPLKSIPIVASGGARIFKQPARGPGRPRTHPQPIPNNPNPHRFHLANHFKLNTAFKKKPPKRLGNGSWKCNYCPAAYPNPVSVKQHESREHPETRPYLCNMCPAGFSTLDGVRKHLTAMHIEVVGGYVKCPYCPRHFVGKIGYEQHIATIHKGKRIPNFDMELAAPPKTGQKSVKVNKAGVGKKKEAVEKKVDLISRPLASPPSPEITDLEGVPVRRRHSSQSAAKKRPAVIELSPPPSKMRGRSVSRTGRRGRPPSVAGGGVGASRTRSKSVGGQRGGTRSGRKEVVNGEEEGFLKGSLFDVMATPTRKRVKKEETSTTPKTKTNGTMKEKETKTGLGNGVEKKDKKLMSEGKGNTLEVKKESEAKAREMKNVETESKTKEKEVKVEEVATATPTTRRRRRTRAASSPSTVVQPSRTPKKVGGKGVEREIGIATCNVCGKSFNGSMALRGHASLHKKGTVIIVKSPFASMIPRPPTPPRARGEEMNEEELVSNGTGSTQNGSDQEEGVEGKKDVPEKETKEPEPSSSSSQASSSEDDDKVQMGPVVQDGGSDSDYTPTAGTTTVMLTLMLPSAD